MAFVELLAEPGLFEVVVDLLAALRHAALRDAVQVDVAEHALLEPLHAGEDAPHLGGLEAVEMTEQVALERDAEVRFEHQGVQERLAELPVADPRTTLGAFERADVDEDRRDALELHVEGVAVLHRDVFLERGEEDLEMHDRRVAEHLERPLVRVRDERDELVLEHRGVFTGRVEPERSRVRRGSSARPHPTRAAPGRTWCRSAAPSRRPRWHRARGTRDHRSRRRSLRGRGTTRARGSTSGDLPFAAPSGERAYVSSEVEASSAFAARRRFGDKKVIVRLHPSLNTTAMPAKPAAIAEAIKLPEFASRYASMRRHPPLSPEVHQPARRTRCPCARTPRQPGAARVAPRNVSQSACAVTVRCRLPGAAVTVSAAHVQPPSRTGTSRGASGGPTTS